MTDEVTQVHRRRRLSRLSLTLLFVAIIVLAMIPFWAIFVATFQDGNMIVRYGLNLGIDFSTASFDNWVALFTDSGSYFRWFFNSTLVTLLQVGLTLAISSFVAYGFAMYEFRFKSALFISVILLMSVPFEMLMLPLYIQINDMQLQDTYTAVILPFLAHAVTIMFFRQYLRGIPKEIVEAGRIDGVTEMGIFFRLVLPLTKPAFAAMAPRGKRRCRASPSSKRCSCPYRRWLRISASGSRPACTGTATFCSTGRSTRCPGPWSARRCGSRRATGWSPFTMRFARWRPMAGPAVPENGVPCATTCRRMPEPSWPMTATGASPGPLVSVRPVPN